MKKVLLGILVLGNVLLAANFEQLGYCKTPNKDRSFIILTDSADKKEMIEHAKKQAWTDFKKTYVTFVKTKKGVKDNSIYSNSTDKGIFLRGMIQNPNVVIGTFSKAPNGNMFWYEGADFIEGSGYTDTVE